MDINSIKQCYDLAYLDYLQKKPSRIFLTALLSNIVCINKYSAYLKWAMIINPSNLQIIASSPQLRSQNTFNMNKFAHFIQTSIKPGNISFFNSGFDFTLMAIPFVFSNKACSSRVAILAVTGAEHEFLKQEFILILIRKPDSDSFPDSFPV